MSIQESGEQFKSYRSFFSKLSEFFEKFSDNFFNVYFCIEYFKRKDMKIKFDLLFAISQRYYIESNS